MKNAKGSRTNICPSQRGKAIAAAVMSASFRNGRIKNSLQFSLIGVSGATMSAAATKGEWQSAQDSKEV